MKLETERGVSRNLDRLIESEARRCTAYLMSSKEGRKALATLQFNLFWFNLTASLQQNIGRKRFTRRTTP